jgi:hypothetical protein
MREIDTGQRPISELPRSDNRERALPATLGLGPGKRLPGDPTSPSIGIVRQKARRLAVSGSRRRPRALEGEIADPTTLFYGHVVVSKGR